MRLSLQRRRLWPAVMGATLALGVSAVMPGQVRSVEARGVVLPVVFRMGADGPEAVNAAVVSLPTISLGGSTSARPAFSNGGCTNNGTCNNLALQSANTYYVNRNSDQFLHGATTYSDLVPASSPHDGYFYDFGDTLTNITSDGDSICIIKNAHSSDSRASAPISYWPTGHRSTGNSGTGGSPARRGTS